MLGFLAIIVAVIALVVAQSAKNRAERLEAEIAQLRAFRPAPPPPPQPTPTAAPPPPPPPKPAPPPVPPREIPVYRPPAPQAAPQPSKPLLAIDWENIVGVKLFSWIAGIALVLAAVFLFKYSVEHGWLRPPIRAGIGLFSGIALLLVCELRVARNYKFTANAMDGAGIAILYATLFAMHSRWDLIPAAVAFFGMLLVTAAAVFLSTRRDSVFVALLGLIGGFATPALLSSGENRPIPLFAYLLLLNGGISWIAFRKRWPLLTALSIGLTVFYQWSWVYKFLTTGQLPLAAGIFVIFAVVGASALWPRGGDDVQPVFRRIAAAAAVVPLIFAFFTAIVPEYGAHFHVLFIFLLLMTGGLAAVALWRGPAWLHLVGATATLVTWFIWLTASYTHAAWPWMLVWLAVFIALYLGTGLRLQSAATHAAALLFFVFIGIAFKEPAHDATAIGAMLALLAVVMVFAIRKAMPYLAANAIALSSIAVMFMRSRFYIDLPAQLALLVAALAIAWIFEKHSLAVIAVAFYAGAVLSAWMPDDASQLLYTAVLYAPFVLYPVLLHRRVKDSLLPHLAAVFGSAVFFFAALDTLHDMHLDDWNGVLAVFVGLVLSFLVLRLLRIEINPTRLAMVAGAALVFFTAAIPLTFDREWMTLGLALEAAALVWLYSRIPHKGLLFWSGLLAAAVLIRLVFNPAVFAYHAKSAMPVVNWYLYIYLVCAAAMFLGAYLARHVETNLMRFFSIAGAVELFFLLNIEIADYYSAGDTLTFNFMGSALAQDLTYTIAWALFAIAMLVTGIILHSRGARVAALGLLLVTILKCFLHDLARLGGLYRVASLFGLAVSLVLVGLMLQKFVMMKRVAEPAAPTADA